MKLFCPHCFMMKSILMTQKVANRSKHTYKRHIFLVRFKVLNMSSSFCAEVLMIVLDKLLIGKPWCEIADKIF